MKPKDSKTSQTKHIDHRPSGKDQVNDVNRSAFEKYGITKKSLVNFNTISFFQNYLFLFGKKIITLGKERNFEKKDLWKLPEDWKTEELYPNFKKYFDMKYNDPNNKDRFEAILFKYVTSSPIFLQKLTHSRHLKTSSGLAWYSLWETLQDSHVRFSQGYQPIGLRIQMLKLRKDG